MADERQPGNDEALQESQQAIDEAKAAAADVVDPDHDELVDDELPASEGGAAADDQAPAS